MISAIFRVDANNKIGSGHIMRCIALAQSIQNQGGSVCFYMANPTESVTNKLKENQLSFQLIHNAPGSLADAEELCTVYDQNNHTGSWVIVDGYHFKEDYQKVIKSHEIPLLCVDDFGHASHYYADIILNQNFSASLALYQHRESYTQLLMGSGYVLLREEFLHFETSNQSSQNIANRILVTFGGSDSKNVTTTILKALHSLPNIEVIAVAGMVNAYLDTLKQIEESCPYSLELKHNVSNMPALMDWADICITASGSACLELAYMGVPSILIITAENQVLAANALQKEAGYPLLGWYHSVTENEIIAHTKTLLTDEGKRLQIHNAAKSLIDGNGANRIIQSMSDICQSKHTVHNAHNGMTA